MKNYVVGFQFASNGSFVTLILKNHPEWQAGKLNGVGGEICDGETPDEAMRREFKEETGAYIATWKRFAILSNKSKFCVHFFWASHAALVASMTSEFVTRYRTDDIINADDECNTVPNLRWMLLMALNDMRGTDNCTMFEVSEIEWRLP
jgi:8-oxo-dGTP diphosphatase